MGSTSFRRIFAARGYFWGKIRGNAGEELFHSFSRFSLSGLVSSTRGHGHGRVLAVLQCGASGRRSLL